LKSSLLRLYDSCLLDGDLGILLHEGLTSSHMKLSERIESALVLEISRIWAGKVVSL
jgi:hypothetical protein